MIGIKVKEDFNSIKFLGTNSLDDLIDPNLGGLGIQLKRVEGFPCGRRCSSWSQPRHFFQAYQILSLTALVNRKPDLARNRTRNPVNRKTCIYHTSTPYGVLILFRFFLHMNSRDFLPPHDWGMRGCCWPEVFFFFFNPSDDKRLMTLGIQLFCFFHHCFLFHGTRFYSRRLRVMGKNQILPIMGRFRRPIITTAAFTPMPVREMGRTNARPPLMGGSRRGAMMGTTKKVLPIKSLILFTDDCRASSVVFVENNLELFFYS